jgi:hypothetical protein
MSDQDQKSEFVKQHKRIAMGVPLKGDSMQPKGTNNAPAKKEGALSQASKKTK